MTNCTPVLSDEDAEALAADYHIEEGDLDEAVYAAANEGAADGYNGGAHFGLNDEAAYDQVPDEADDSVSAVNNRGTVGQLQYLADFCGNVEALRSLLNDIMAPPAEPQERPAAEKRHERAGGAGCVPLVLAREPWRGGQVCGHQTVYGMGPHSERYCGERKAPGEVECAAHAEETGMAYGVVKFAVGNAKGDPSAPLVLLWEPQEGTEPIEPTEEERAMFAAATAATAAVEREAADLLGDGEKWMRHFCQFGQTPRVERVDRAAAVELIVSSLRHGGWQVYRADKGGVNLESPTGESSYRLRPARAQE